MKCPKCGINLLEHIEVCPFCKTPVPKKAEANKDVTSAKNETPAGQNTGRFSAIDTSRDSYDFDLQYTLTFRDSGEIRQAIADMDAGIVTRESAKKKLNTDKKKSNEPRYTLEEMQEAALRAQERRERRKNAQSGSLKHNNDKKHVTRTEKRKNDALRAAKPSKTYSNTDKPVHKSHRGLLIGTAVLALVVVLIVGIVNVCSYFAHKDPEFPTVYTKGNELYSYFEGDEIKLSSNFITIERVSEEDDESSNDSKSSKKVNDPKISEEKALGEKELIIISEDGINMFFFENVNMDTRTGTLVYYQNGKKKSRRELAHNVYCDINVGKDGTSVMYLKNTDDDGNHGELCYWTLDKKQEVSVDTDICTGNFKLSQDCLSATYIKNFNPIVHTGDLFYVSFAENAGAAKRVDEKVAFVFGTTPKSKTYFYAKNYDTKTGTYDLYIQSDTEGPKVIAEKGLCEPVISQKIEVAYIYSNSVTAKSNSNSNSEGMLQTLNYVDLSTGSNTKLTDDVTEILKIRNDDGAVIYSKEYAADKADYYFVSAKSPNPQKVATAVNLEAVEDGIVSFDASDDFSKVAYIGGFNSTTMRGALYTMSIINDYSGSEIRISDDAYNCDVSADGAVIRFASGYNAENNTVNIISYSNSNTLALADSVALGAFTFDKTGEYAIYATEVDSAKSSGKINTVSKKAKIKNLDADVSAYGLKKDGTVLLLKKSGEGEAQTTALYRTNLKGRKAKLLTDNINKVLSY